jgi:hypothetical protein
VRERLGITTIGAIDVGPQARRQLRKRKSRLRSERIRRANGARSQVQSLSRTRPWRALGVARATYYRHRETTSYAACLLYAVYLSVSPRERSAWMVRHLPVANCLLRTNRCHD